MQAIPATNDTAADEHRSTEVTIPAAPTENGGRNAEENTSNVETLAQLPERHLNQVHDELEQFVSPCFVVTPYFSISAFNNKFNWLYLIF